jgi:hypothetical protein
MLRLLKQQSRHEIYIWNIKMYYIVKIGYVSHYFRSDNKEVAEIFARQNNAKLEILEGDQDEKIVNDPPISSFSSI